MVITVKIPDELVVQAQSRGIPLEAYVEQLLAGQVEGTAANRPKTTQEIQAWLSALAQYSDKIPPLPETISREWLYQDHD